MRRSILPDLKEMPEHSARGDLQVQKRTLDFEDQDVLALVTPLDPEARGDRTEFLGSLLSMDDLKPVLEVLVSENRPPDSSLRILKLMITRKGQVITRDEFLDLIWGVENLNVSHRTVDSHIAHIRKKVEDDPSRPKFIRSLHGVGYKFVD